MDSFNVVYVVSLDGQSFFVSRFVKEVMVGVVDDQMEIKVVSEVYGELDLGNIGDVDGVRWEVFQSVVVVEGGVVGFIGGILKLRRYDRSGINDIECGQYLVRMYWRLVRFIEWLIGFSYLEGIGIFQYCSVDFCSKLSYREQF